jgi:hypothetical protein
MDQVRWLTETIRYDPRLGYVMLQLPHVSLPPTLHLDGTLFEAKTELHVSLLSTQKLAENFLDKEQANEKLVSYVEEYVSNNLICFDYFTKQLYVCEYEESRSIVLGAIVDGVDRLFSSLSSTFPELAYLSPPALHVTLYKYNHQYGIGIQDERQLRELCRPIELETLSEEVRRELYEQI